MENRVMPSSTVNLPIDRRVWIPGPWDDEGDYGRWVNPETGYTIIVKRIPNGVLCGYVGVPDGHPLYKTDYMDSDFHVPNVHGGVTFTGEWDDDGLFYIGFDCGQMYDSSPQMISMLDFALREHEAGKTIYRDWDYVCLEADELARNLKEIEDSVSSKKTERSDG
jgi:hypothetical protein